MIKHGWKIICVLLLFYTIIGGFMMETPRLAILNETIRALYFHVPMWFAMVTMFTIAGIYAIRYLKNPSTKNDIISTEFINTGLVFGTLGILTGMIWAQFTWGSAWHNDPKQNGSAIAMLIYLTYFILRKSTMDQEQKAKLSAVYNIFAFFSMIPLLFILPRMVSSMHPGSGGNPGFNMYDLDNNMRLIFYPAVVGWILLAIWITSLRLRMRNLEDKCY